MGSDLVDRLCRSIFERQEALRRMGSLSATSAVKQPWWSSDEQLAYWWIRRHAEESTDTDPRTVNLREAAEALVRLGILASVDYRRCKDVVREIWSPETSFPPEDERTSPPARCVMAYKYPVYTRDCLAPISERVFGYHPPSDSFAGDYAWIKRQLGAHNLAFTPRAVPVRLDILLPMVGPLELSYVLRQIVQNVLAQQLYAKTEPADEKEEAALTTRFEIVEVRLRHGIGATADADALECIARLVELGIAVKGLPRLRDEDSSTETVLSVVKSLHKLLPPRTEFDASSSRFVGHVYVYEDTQHLTQAILSAVQVNRTLPSVEIRGRWDPLDWEDMDRHDDVIELWQMVAYALFSRHAEHDLREIALHVHHLDERMLEDIQGVLEADNPLAALYETTFDDDQWLTASIFLVENPEELYDCVDSPQFVTSAPLTVRVIDRLELNSELWWRVLLPGCGEAWVWHANASEVVSGGVRSPNVETQSAAGVIRLVGFAPGNTNNTLSLLKLISGSMRILRIEREDSVDQTYDVTEWTTDLLLSCPNLVELSLPMYAQISFSRSLVQLAEAGHIHLRCLALDNLFSPESSDIVEFLGVLSDMSHPLTRQLEHFSFCVSDDGPTAGGFAVAWTHMLNHNRKLQTITLVYSAETCVDTGDLDVAIRTGPLDLSSKLAFLSVQHPSHSGPTSSARDRLDTAVLAMIFAFAAQHTIRVVEIEFDESY